MLAAAREASVCVRNSISTVPDTIISLLGGVLLCVLRASKPACGLGGEPSVLLFYFFMGGR
jgi:hypothetical protein